MPPRHSKSLLCSHYTPAWYLGTFPDRRVILTSYASELAEEGSSKARDVMSEYGSELFGVRVRPDKKAAHNWKIHGNTGACFAGGLLGGLTGRGADLLIVDDPIRGPEDAASKAIRDRTWNAYTGAATTRLAPGGCIVLIQTRWHEDDVAGRVLREQPDRWTVLNFSAIAEEDDPLERAPGEALWPERFGLSELMERKADLASDYLWQALYQQRPVPPGGAVFKQQWFRYATIEGEGAERYFILYKPEGNQTLRLSDCWFFAIADTASTTKTHSDFTAVGFFAVTPQFDLIVVEVLRAKLEEPDIVPTILPRYRAWGCTFLGVEAKASGFGVIQEARRKGLAVKELTPRTVTADQRPLRFEPDKYVRSFEAQVRYEAGQVYHLQSTAWLGAFESEMLSFSADGAHAYDDQVDMVSYAAKEVYRRVSSENEDRPMAFGGAW